MRSCLPLLIGLLVPSVAVAENWPNWRGPTGDGVAATDAKAGPTEWDTDTNVVWKVKLPSRGGSTPIVWNDQVIVTATTDNGENAVLAFDRDGNSLWTTSFGTKKPGKHRKASGCNPSPCTDGELVYAYFKSGDLAGLTMDGKIVWQTNLQQKYGEDTLWWDLGTSPVLTSDAVVVAVMQDGPSYLVAFDKKSGEVKWKTDRMAERAPKENDQSYTTPIVTEHDGKELIIVAGAEMVTATDAATGKELWRYAGLNQIGKGYLRSISSPILSDGVIVAAYERGDSFTAVPLEPKDTSDPQALWRKAGYAAADVPTPCVRDGKLYNLGDKGRVSCLEIKTGEEVWSEHLPRHRMAYSASPTLIGDQLYLTREDGTTFVVSIADGFKLISENPLDEQTVATPVPLDGKLLIRTFEHLWCVGE